MNTFACATMSRPMGRRGPSRVSDAYLRRLGVGDLAKNGHDRARAEPSSQKRLDRKLAKLEARLADAADKRDRAQARGRGSADVARRGWSRALRSRPVQPW